MREREQFRKVRKQYIKTRLIITIVMVSLVSILIGSVYLYSQAINRGIQTAAINSLTSTIKEKNSIVIFEGLESSGIDSMGAIQLDKELFDRVEFNGSFSMIVTYKSLETQSLGSKDHTEIILDKFNLGLSEPYIKKELELTSEYTKVEIPLYSDYLYIKEDGASIRGYNWTISMVELVMVDSDGNWYWDSIDVQRETILPPNTSNPSGLYPSDPVLRNWAKLFEYAEDTGKSKDVSGWTILGLIYRESGRAVPIELNDASFNIETDLVLRSPECHKGSRCPFPSHRSHFTNGGNAYNDTVYTGRDYYNGDHAIGPMQFETIFWDNRASYHGSSTTSGGKYAIDTELGFMRPSPFYLPDAVQSTVNYMSYSRTQDGAGTSLNNLLNSNDFKSLSDDNKSFILGFLYDSSFNRGSINRADVRAANHIIGLVKSGRINHIASEICAGIKDHIYIKSGRYGGNFGSERTANYLKNTWGFTEATGTYNGRVYWYIAGQSAGYYAWNDIQDEINAAAKIPQVGSTAMRDKVVEVAKNEINAGESTGGWEYINWYNKAYGTRFGKGTAWCAIFVSHVLETAGVIDAGGATNFSLCTNGGVWFKNKGKWMDSASKDGVSGDGYIPQPGDVIFFKNGQNSRWTNHVGIVNYVEDTASGKIVHTYEGNTSNKTLPRAYKIDNPRIVGYGLIE